VWIKHPILQSAATISNSRVPANYLRGSGEMRGSRRRGASAPASLRVPAAAAATRPAARPAATSPPEPAGRHLRAAASLSTKFAVLAGQHLLMNACAGAMIFVARLLPYAVANRGEPQTHALNGAADVYLQSTQCECAPSWPSAASAAVAPSGACPTAAAAAAPAVACLLLRLCGHAPALRPSGQHACHR